MQVLSVSGMRRTALLIVFCFAAPFMAGCGHKDAGDSSSAGAPMSSDQPKPGLSTGQKTAILVGAAALYYLYKKHQAAAGSETGPTGKLYRSESTGAIYYRDAQHKPHFVSPPKGGISVPADERDQFMRENKGEIDRTHFGADSEPLPAGS